jgi:hypothetical protein
VAKKLDLAKTQFLFENNGLTTTMRLFRRKRALVLLRPDGLYTRPISYHDWRKLQKDYPDEVKAEGLYVETVWTLEEIKNG